MFEDDQRALTDIALVCKTFFGPAMDASWRTVEDISRLVYTLPPDVVAFVEPADYEDPSDRQWVRPRTTSSTHCATDPAHRASAAHRQTSSGNGSTSTRARYARCTGARRSRAR